MNVILVLNSVLDIWFTQISGPVMHVMKFRTMDEVIERTNSTSHGLAAGISTSNLDKAMTYSRRVRAGTVWFVNLLQTFDCNGLMKS